MVNDEMLNKIEEWNNNLATRQELVSRVCPVLDVDSEGLCRLKPCLLNDDLRRKCGDYINCGACREAYWRQLMIKGEDGKYHEKI